MTNVHFFTIRVDVSRDWRLWHHNVLINSYPNFINIDLKLNMLSLIKLFAEGY